MPAPWEWDVKRLAASVHAASEAFGSEGESIAQAVAGTVRSYRERMRDLAEFGPLDVWYDRIDVQRVLDIAKQRKARGVEEALRVDKVRRRTSLTALPKLTAVATGGRRIIDYPPLINHEGPEAQAGPALIARYARASSGT